MFQSEFTKTVVALDGEKPVIMQYKFSPKPNPYIPWRYFGVLTGDERLVGMVNTPRHMKRSEEYHALMTWIVDDIVQQGMTIGTVL